MKKQLAFLGVLFMGLGIWAQDAGSSIMLDITNIKSSEGKLMIGLYKKEANWLKIPYKGYIGNIENGKCELLLTDIPSGTYAISMFHDENNNDKLDMLFGFIPKEGTACSNNAPSSFGPPKWEDAIFEIKGESITQTIKF